MEDIYKCSLSRKEDIFKCLILKPNSAIIDIIKCYDYKTKNGKVKILENTNLKFIEPAEYLILSPIQLTIYENKVNEISNKQFYIKEHNEKYTFQEISKLLKL